ncbi:MAG: hypothetical protein PHS49_04435 [Candidatus Gracilibacteria bacterium]|nr:hypothetical protein [Candidatus Gracilibacteria bacterium]
MENKRFIELKKIPIILSIIFSIIFYLLLLKYFNSDPNLTDINHRDFYLKYTMISPIVFGLLSLVLFYILTFIKFILRLNYLAVTILIYLLVYGFFLFLGIDFMYFESKIAPLASLIIDTFSIPLIFSSIMTIVMIILLSFKKIK